MHPSNIFSKQYGIVVMLVLFSLLVSTGTLFSLAFFHHHEPAHFSSCPFMPSESVLCAMTPWDHLSAWQSSYAFPAIGLFALLLLFSFVVYTLRSIVLPHQHFLFHGRVNRAPPILFALIGVVINPRAP